MKNSKGHNSVNMLVKLRFLFSAHCLKVVYTCTNFHENILDGIKFIEWTHFHVKNLKGGIIP